MQAKVLSSTKGMPRDEWLELRKNGIGGSDAAAVLGLHPFASPVSVWADKTGRSPETPDNEAMWLGRILEEPVAKRIAEENSIKIRRRNAMLQHPKYPWMIADIDYEMVGEKAGVEIKTTNAFTKIDFENDEIPPYYYVQCMHYMAVTGYAYWYLFVYVVGRKPYKFIILRNESEIEALIQTEKHFWEHNVQKDIMPEPDGSEASASIIKTLYPEPKEPVNLIGFDDHCKKYLDLDAQIKGLKQEQDKVKQELQVALVGAELADCIDYTIKWTVRKGRTTLDTKALEADMPDIYKRYARIGEPSRAFSIKKKEV